MTDRETQRRLAKLDALEAGGVDNWEFYGESLEGWNKETHVDECIDEAIDGINELLCEVKIEEPAGRGCGYSITFDESDMVKLLVELVNKSQEG